MQMKDMPLLSRASSDARYAMTLATSFPKRRLARVHALFAAVAGSSLVAAAQPVSDEVLFDRWASVTQPLPGPATPIGFYSAGCLHGAQALSPDGPGYAVMHPSRHRFYGHPSLVSYVTTLAARTHNDTGKLLLVGDLGLPRGGPMLTGHASHQNGLDADIWFMTRANRPTYGERETLSASRFVSGRKRLRPNWGAAQARLLVAAADNADVNRIFVSPPIKRYMCRNFPTASWLYRLRAWWGHEDHFHVRLKCPGDHSLCREQDALNATDDGCGADLEWWFSSEADRDWAKIAASTERRAFPELPAECKAAP
jgi:penicillin-insensitive murein DD-endopeptidase